MKVKYRCLLACVLLLAACSNADRKGDHICQDIGHQLDGRYSVIGQHIMPRSTGISQAPDSIAFDLVYADSRLGMNGEWYYCTGQYFSDHYLFYSTLNESLHRFQVDKDLQQMKLEYWEDLGGTALDTFRYSWSR